MTSHISLIEEIGEPRENHRLYPSLNLAIPVLFGISGFHHRWHSACHISNVFSFTNCELILINEYDNIPISKSKINLEAANLER